MALSETEHLSATQFELAAQLLLGRLPVQVEAGPWWAYRPAQATIDYPRALLSTWPKEWLVAAFSHEAAEARFTGVAGGRAVADWIKLHTDELVTPANLTVLANVINDMRVNRLHIARYPRTARLFRQLYTRGIEIEAMTDTPSVRQKDSTPLHHQYLDALIHTWTESQWPGNRTLPELEETVADGLSKTCHAALAAAEHDDIQTLLDSVTTDLLPTYRALLQTDQISRDRTKGVAQHGPNTPDDADPGLTTPSTDNEDAQADGFASVNHIDSDEHDTDTDDLDATARFTTDRSDNPSMKQQAPTSPASITQEQRRKSSSKNIRDQVLGSTGDSWHPGLISTLRQGDGTQVNYETFSYISAAEKLAPFIHEAIYGNSQRSGLAEIMNRRRHGAVDPWRRPRKMRSRETGEIDLEHPERLLTDPTQAFLHGIRIAREDRQRDFANAILLDISGSMVQRGFPTKKFDRLVDAAVMFIEIHERLKIPYAVLSFSSTTTVHWRFNESVWTSPSIASASKYQPRDHSLIFRTLYALDHRDTDDANAVTRAVSETLPQKGLKSVLVITDGISTNPAELRRVLTDIDRRNQNLPPSQATKILAFGIGVAQNEFETSYMPYSSGKPLRCCYGETVHDISLLPTLIRDCVDRRIREA